MIEDKFSRFGQTKPSLQTIIERIPDKVEAQLAKAFYDRSDDDDDCSDTDLMIREPVELIKCLKSR